jgi:hypothetical protein
MPSIRSLARLRQLASLPETRRAIVSTVRAGHLQNVARRAVHDRAGMLRDVRDRATSRDVLRATVQHPATRELAGAGLLFLPVRYMPLGWAATWAARRVLRPSRTGPLKNVTPPEG